MEGSGLVSMAPAVVGDVVLAVVAAMDDGSNRDAGEAIEGPLATEVEVTNAEVAFGTYL